MRSSGGLEKEEEDEDGALYSKHHSSSSAVARGTTGGGGSAGKLPSPSPSTSGGGYKYVLNDFVIMDLLGEGAYARVYKAKHKVSEEVYAIKMLDKKFITRHRKEHFVMTEKNVLSKMSHRSIMKMHSTFQDSASLYFLLEYCPGGDLIQHVKRLKGIPIEMVRFAMAEVIEALQYLHTNGIIHRDLKPENILLNAEGHVILTDFGTAKIMDMSVSESARKNSFVGTAEYVSPELLKDEPASFAVDFWSLGCVIFVLLSGKPPFRGGSEYLTFQKILKREFEFPESFPDDAKDLVDKLLQMNPKERLGAADINDLKMHRFFKSIVWETLPSSVSPCLELAEATITGATSGGAFEDIMLETGPSEDLTSSAASSAASSMTLEGDLTRKTQVEKKEKDKEKSWSRTIGSRLTFGAGSLSLSRSKIQPSFVSIAAALSEEWKQFLVAEERVLLQGVVMKRGKMFSVKRRILLLTSLPRFVYIDPEIMVKKGEIPWHSMLFAEKKSDKMFQIVTPKRVYIIEPLDVAVQDWVDKINSLTKSK